MQVPPLPTSTPPGAIVIIGLTAFFTLVDLFGPQAITPSIAMTFAASAPEMGLAINAATIGMMAAGAIGSLFTDRIGRKRLIVGALAILSLPTAMLALCSDLLGFEALRAAQGLLMCAGFAAAIAYIAEEWGPTGAAPILMGSYLAGNVAANMLGRIMAGAATHFVSWRFTFIVFAFLNLLGAGLLQMLLPTSRGQPSDAGRAVFQTLRMHLKNRALCGALAVGYLILFVFVGMFTYVNFRLGQLPFDMSAGSIGLIYVIFLPALLTTLAVGAAVRRAGYRRALIFGTLLSLIGTGLTLTDRLAAMLLGLALVAVGLFFAQGVATAFTGYIAQGAKGTASGLYLAAYYAGGLSGAWVMGRIFDMLGWTGCAIAASVGCVLMMSIVGASWRPVKNIPNDPPSLRGPILLQRASTG